MIQYINENQNNESPQRISINSTKIDTTESSTTIQTSKDDKMKFNNYKKQDTNPFLERVEKTLNQLGFNEDKETKEKLADMIKKRDNGKHNKTSKSRHDRRMIESFLNELFPNKRDLKITLMTESGNRAIRVEDNGLINLSHNRIDENLFLNEPNKMLKMINPGRKEDQRQRQSQVEYNQRRVEYNGENVEIQIFAEDEII